jgi:hypothetical protein
VILIPIFMFVAGVALMASGDIQVMPAGIALCAVAIVIAPKMLRWSRRMF